MVQDAQAERIRIYGRRAHQDGRHHGCNQPNMQKKPFSVRKIRVSAILGPETAAPILWTPGKMRSFCRKTYVHKIPPFRGGGGIFGFWWGGGKADFIFMGARIFLKYTTSICVRASYNYMIEWDDCCCCATCVIAHESCSGVDHHCPKQGQSALCEGRSSQFSQNRYFRTGVVLCARACFCLLSAFYNTPPPLRTLLNQSLLIQNPYKAPSKKPSKKPFL